MLLKVVCPLKVRLVPFTLNAPVLNRVSFSNILLEQLYLRLRVLDHRVLSQARSSTILVLLRVCLLNRAKSSNTLSTTPIPIHKHVLRTLSMGSVLFHLQDKHKVGNLLNGCLLVRLPLNGLVLDLLPNKERQDSIPAERIHHRVKDSRRDTMVAQGQHQLQDSPWADR